MKAETTRSHGRVYAVLSVLIVALGGLIAAARLGTQSLWLDETYTWWFARLGWADLLQATRLDAVNPPFYYLYVKLLAPGGSEAALRIPSVLAQVGGIAGAILLGRLLAGWAGGLAAGAVWALHPLTLWAARDARPYALAAALAVVAVALFVRLRHSWSKALASLAVIVLALGLMTHYFFFVLVASLVVLAAFDLRSDPVFFRRWTLVALLATIPLAAWLVWFFSSGSPSLGIGWIRRPVIGDIPLTLWNLASGYAGRADLQSTLFGAVSLLLAGAALFSTPRRAWLKITSAGLAIPVLAVWAISQRRPVYVDRYFVVLMPFVAAAIALGVDACASLTSSRRAMRLWLLAGFAMAALAAASTVHFAAKFDKEDWRGLTTNLASHGVEPAILSLSEPEAALPLAYYGVPGLMDGRAQLIPACQAECWWVLRQPYTATHALTQSVSEPGRSAPPLIPPGCSRSEAWESPTGVAAWHLVCPSAAR